MTLEAERRVGVRGLSLGADPTQLGQGALTLADGVRYLELGAAHSRGGRVRAGFEFPTEQYDTTGYQQTVAHFKASGRVRGFAPFYDQRIWPTTSDNITVGYPQRLYYVHKANNTFYLNDDYVGSGTGVLTGDGSFTDSDTRAKFVVYGDRTYVIDEKDAPRVMRRLPKASQSFLTRIKYGVTRLGIQWPTTGTSDPADLAQKPTTSTATVGGIPLLVAGLYRFRIMLEDANGTRSAPSAPVEKTVVTVAGFDTVNVLWNTVASTFPAGIVKVRVYVQFTAENNTATEPSAYLYLGSNDVENGATGVSINIASYRDLANREVMRGDQGAPPILTEMCIVNNVAYAASGVDVIYREIGESVVGNTTVPFRYSQRTPDTIPIWASKNQSKMAIRAISVNRSYLFVSAPGEPDYMENFFQIGNGSEIIVGLAPLGKTCVIFTNQGLYTFNAVDGEIHTGFARVGCISRDSIVATEHGVRFVATDGVPRLFNGATIEETAEELLPIFDRDDYVGEYERFDKANAQEIIGTSGDRKFFMLFPVGGGGSYKPGVVIDSGSSKYLAIGDNSTGATRWSIDKTPSYDIVYWLGREARLLAIDGQGYFYFIEEGAMDQQPFAPDGTPLPDEPPQYGVSTRRFSAGGLMAQFYCVALDVNTQGQTLTFTCRIDDVPELSKDYQVTTTGREEAKLLLPSYFKGRYLDVKGFGTPSVRVALYGLTVESARRGEFS